MKKLICIIPAISVALLLFLFVPFTASATEGLYVDVLDYETLNGSGSNSGNVNTTGSLYYDFTDTYGKARCYSFDVLFSFSGNSNFTIDSVNFGVHSVDFEYEVFTSGMCRVSGNCSGLQQSKLTFNITSAGTTYFTFSSIKLYTVPSNVISVPAVLTDDMGNSSTIAINSSGSVHPVIPSGVSSYNVRYSVAIPYEYWSCFDLLSFSFRTHCQSLNSVSALIGISTEALPCDVSFISDPYSAGYIYGSVFVDVSNLIKADYSDSLYIYFNSSVGVNSGNFLVHAINGHLFTDGADPLTVFLQLINSNVDLIESNARVTMNYVNSIRLYFNSTLTSALESIYLELESIDNRLSNIYLRLGAINTSLGTINSSLGTINTSLGTINTTLGIINTSISDFQASVESDWDILLDTKLPSFYARLGNMHDTMKAFQASVESDFDTLWVRITGLSSDIRSYIETLELSMIRWFDQVSSQLQELIEGQPVDETVVDDMQQSEDELGSMTQEMGSMTPEVNANDVNIPLDDLIPSDNTSANNIMITITNNELVLQFLLIAVSFATIGFVFFGKR